MDVASQTPTLSLTDGGPGAAILRRLHFGPWDFSAASPRTAVLLIAITWPPLFVLSWLQGTAFSGPQIPFLYDLASHTRFLVAVPLLMLADRVIGARLRRTADNFLAAGLVPPGALERFAQVIANTIRFRDSRVADWVVIAAAYVGSLAATRLGPEHGLHTWFVTPNGGGLTLAGYYYTLVALPIFQFLMLRWIYRMIVWTRFLKQVAGLDLLLTPTHPDGAGGVGFLGASAPAFGPVLFATSAVMASGVATSVLFAGAKLKDFGPAYATLLVLALLVFAGPLLVFAPVLVQLKRRSLLEYGALASQYTQLFHRKWVHEAGAGEETILGSADIQSLADLSTSYELVHKMRIVPIEIQDFVRIAVPAVIPVIPLLATVMPVGDILKSLLRLLG